MIVYPVAPLSTAGSDGEHVAIPEARAVGGQSTTFVIPLPDASTSTEPVGVAEFPVGVDTPMEKTSVCSLPYVTLPGVAVILVDVAAALTCRRFGALTVTCESDPAKFPFGAYTATRSSAVYMPAPSAIGLLGEHDADEVLAFGPLSGPVVHTSVQSFWFVPGA